MASARTAGCGKCLSTGKNSESLKSGSYSCGGQAGAHAETTLDEHLLKSIRDKGIAATPGW